MHSGPRRGSAAGAMMTPIGGGAGGAMGQLCGWAGAERDFRVATWGDMPTRDAASALAMITHRHLRIRRIIRHIDGNSVVARASSDPDQLASRRHTVAPRIVMTSATIPTHREPKPGKKVPAIRIDSGEGPGTIELAAAMSPTRRCANETPLFFGNRDAMSCWKARNTIAKSGP